MCNGSETKNKSKCDFIVSSRVMNEWYFRPRFCTCKAINTGPGTTWDDEINFVMKHAPMNDVSDHDSVL